MFTASRARALGENSRGTDPSLLLTFEGPTFGDEWLTASQTQQHLRAA